ncbi:MAG: slipin family protein [Rhodospirillales bacterium]|nr:slipin family protein [Rhodospirillales bacterium]
MLGFSNWFVPLVAALVVGAVYHLLWILREYERFVIFTLGRFTGVRGPGLVIVVPFIQKGVRIDLRVRVLEVPTQDVISRDNVSAKVNAVIYYRVTEPAKAIIEVEDFETATSQLAQTTLRSVLGEHELDAMLAERKMINENIQTILDEHYGSWGIKVSSVEIKAIDLDESMVRAIARQAEAERNRRARVIEAEGEFQAAAKLSDAAEILSQRREAMQLRYLTALESVAGDKASTVIFPLPIDLLSAIAPSQGPKAKS